MAFNPKDAVDAARDIATNAVEKASGFHVLERQGQGAAPITLGHGLGRAKNIARGKVASSERFVEQLGLGPFTHTRRAQQYQPVRRPQRLWRNLAAALAGCKPRHSIACSSHARFEFE